MKQFEIYLDVDGVLADFMGAALVVHGFDPEITLGSWPRGEWDAWKVLGLSSEGAFWSKISRNSYFWDDIPALPWSREIVRMVSKYDPGFHFATKPSRCKSCFGGKSEWIRKLGYEPSEKLIVIPDKSKLSASGRLLIDDNEDNCLEWERRGGKAILFPQPWNSNSHVSLRASYIKDRLEKLHR